jgi:ribosomal-protein-alanine N-acetyltransferase
MPSLPWPLVIKTKRLVLRPYKASDYAAWVEAFSGRRPAQNDFDDGPKPRRELTRARFAGIRKRHRENARRDIIYVWAVFEKKSGQIVGWMDLFVYDRANAQWANFGYALHNQHWGKGFAREAAAALAIVGFRKLKLQRLEAAIAPDNRASLRLIKDLGFRREGRRQCAEWRGGAWKDDLVFAATPEDFGLKAKPPSVKRRL